MDMYKSMQLVVCAILLCHYPVAWISISRIRDATPMRKRWCHAHKSIHSFTREYCTMYACVYCNAITQGENVRLNSKSFRKMRMHIQAYYKCIHAGCELKMILQQICQHTSDLPRPRPGHYIHRKSAQEPETYLLWARSSVDDECVWDDEEHNLPFVRHR